MLQEMNTNAKKKKNKIRMNNMIVTLEQLKKIAEIEMEGASTSSGRKAIRKGAKDLFAGLDADEDGYITKDEILSSRMGADLGKELMKKLFQLGLDTDNDGYLSFRDSMPILYLSIICSSRKCKACHISLVFGLAFSCVKCIRHQFSSSDHDHEFSICHRCFTSISISQTLKFHHPQHKPRHMRHDFDVFHLLLHHQITPDAVSPLPSTPPQQSSSLQQPTMQQCISCGDFHTSTTKGFMCDDHMSVSPSSSGSNYVCEWCFCYFCFKCGNPFRDNVACATPAKWLKRFICLTCSQQSPQPPHDLYQTIIQRYQHLLSNAEILGHCKTCKIKQKNGTLFWYVNGTNKLDTNNALTSPPVQSSPLFQDNFPQVLQHEPYEITLQKQSLQHQTQSHASFTPFQFGNRPRHTPFQPHQSQGHSQYQYQYQLANIADKRPQLQQQGQAQSQVVTQLADFANVATSVASNVAVAVGRMLVADTISNIINNNNP